MIGQDQFPEENIPYDHQSQYDIRQSMWDKLNNLHMLVSDHVHDKKIQRDMCQLLHKTHDDIDKLFTAIKEETIDAKPAKEPKYTVATGSAISAETKLWFSAVASARTGCYYFGPFETEQDADKATAALKTALELINSLVL